MMKRGAEAGAASIPEKRVKGIVDMASRLSQKLEECYSKLTPGDLVSNQTWCCLVAPDMSGKLKEFDYMGRAFTRDVVDFILQPRQGPPRLLDPFASRKYVTGTPGYGETVSICAGTGFLYAKSAMARKRKLVSQEAQVDEQEGGGEKQEGGGGKEEVKEWALPDDISDCRFLLLSGKSFVQDPGQAFFMALVLAYIDDADTLKELEILRDDPVTFLSLRSEKVYIILDDGNAIDLEKGDPPALAELKIEAWRFIQLVPGNIVICASVRSRLRHELAKTAGAQYLFRAGGFDMMELKAYLGHIHKKIEDLDHAKTGWVPRLVDQCLLAKEQMKQTVEGLEKALCESIQTSEGWAREQLLRAIAGRRISMLSECLDSRCFYQGKNGKGRCLTSYLHSRAFGWVAQNVQRRQDMENEAEIHRFTLPISGSSNLCNIGWNAEEATILALRLLDTELAGVNVTIRPRRVSVFDKQITRRMVTTKTATLFIPSNFNHTGADVYYADQEVLVVFQISVAEKAVELHTKTKEVAEKLFRGDSRTKVLAWVIAQKKSSFVPENDSGYAEVFTTFEDLHHSLSCIDERVMKLRGNKNSICKQCGEARGGEEVECHYCGGWYHGKCTDYKTDQPWICEDCKLGTDCGEDEDVESSDEYDEDEEEEDDDDE